MYKKKDEKDMSKERQIQMVQTRVGRIKLHFYTLIRDHKLAWHYNGIMRELKKV